MKATKPPYQALLFDLGGVLIKLVGVPRMMELTGRRYSVSELWEKWITSPVIRQFESGKLTVDEFGERVVKEFGMDILPSRFLEEFIMWPVGKYPGVNELLTSVKPYVAIASLSNTNELHWNRMVAEMDFIHLFDYNFPSHQTAHLKPDLETYLYTAEELGIRPGDALFFDDNRINIEGARAAGMDAIEAHGVADVKAHLISIGLL
jgi:HAD superfamily hydrolase (TIGR01509 family)